MLKFGNAEKKCGGTDDTAGTAVLPGGGGTGGSRPGRPCSLIFAVWVAGGYDVAGGVFRAIRGLSRAIGGHSRGGMGCRFLANEGLPEESRLLGNEFAVAADGWVPLVGYGDFVHGEGVQRFMREDAETLVNEFNSLRGLPQRLLGLPWYIGHPDHPKFKDRYADTRAYGRIKGLEAREEGLFANVKWSAAGEDLIRSEAFHGHSVNWGAVKRGGVWRPVRIKSVGFTNEPNIPVRPVTLANEMNDSMKEQLLQKLGLAADATDEQILAAVDAAIEAKRDGENTETLKAEKLKAEDDLANEKAAAEALKAEKLKAEADLANERKARIGLLLDGAIAGGKITAADRGRWEADLGGDFEGKATELANAKPVLKTESQTKNLGQRKESSAAGDKVVELCNERMAKTGEDWTAAWAALKREHPALFDQMTTAKAE